MALSSKVYVAESPSLGGGQRSILCRESLEPGELVWWVEESEEPGLRLTREEILAHPESATLARYSYMLDDDLFETSLEPIEDPSFYFNHSCEPNLGYEPTEQLVALRRVEVGEELSYDYAMTETEASFHAGLECACGAPSCRGRLDMMQWRSPLFVRRYSGQVSRYIRRRSRQQSWNDPRIAIRRYGPSDLGLRALADIPAGQAIIVFAGKVVGLDELRALSPRERALSLQVHDRLWQVPVFRGGVREPGDFINHSCDANCGLEDSTTLVTLRPISAGEPVTMDYATANNGAIGLDPSDNFPCRCGSEHCRGTISSEDWRREDVVQRYWPHFPPFLKRLIIAEGGPDRPEK